ncbi:toprim domain-containing protein [Aquimarina sp. AU119]|uniref:toprim domain-containing protein n=1 Tax=Aquimarina sp. AU119 TaxID=2108528 RepID=UPI000D687DE2|nr:toprim domain-containing protein [Aquimarina sp. AU119]
MKTTKLTCEKARNISIVQTLGKLGHFPKRETEKEAWFLSPFRKETQASFKVSKQLNRWYDHGEGFGGNVIDLIIKSQKCTIKEALYFLSQDHFFSFHQRTVTKKEEIKKDYEILKVKKLENQALLEYLTSRSIDLEIAQKYCQEIYYRNNYKNYFSISFKNDQDGYELRNKYFKGCLGKKAVTTLGNDSDCICVFEGFMDFLSYKTLYKFVKLDEDYIICNSTSLVKSITSKLQYYHTVYACLDNDNTGNKATSFLKENHSGVFDCSILYKSHNDINDYLIGKS